MYFEKAGPQNTEKTLEIATNVAKERNIKYIVVASTFGDTGIKLAKMMQGSDIKVIVVTHNAGFKEEGVCELSDEKRKEIEKYGGIVLTQTMVLRGLGCAIRDKFGYSEQEIVNATLRMFGQGIKVCAEISAMVCDAGIVPPSDIVAVAGTGRGADTAVIIRANSSNKFFDIKIREILCKPKDF